MLPWYPRPARTAGRAPRTQIRSDRILGNEVIGPWPVVTSGDTSRDPDGPRKNCRIRNRLRRRLQRVPGCARVRSAAKLVARLAVPRRVFKRFAAQPGPWRGAHPVPFLDFPCALTPFVQRWFHLARCFQPASAARPMRKVTDLILPEAPHWKPSHYDYRLWCLRIVHRQKVLSSVAHLF